MLCTHICSAFTFYFSHHVTLLTCSLQVHLCQVFGEFTGAGHYCPLPWDVGHCVPAACAITVDEFRVRRLHIHHLSMTSALITPARGRRRGSKTAAEVLHEANKSPCCLPSVVCRACGRMCCGRERLGRKGAPTTTKMPDSWETIN